MERICIICGKTLNDDDDLRDRFGCHTDIHARCYPAIVERFDAHTAAQPAPDAVAEAAKVLLDNFSAKDLKEIYAKHEGTNGSLAKAWGFQAMLRYITEGTRP